MTENEWKTAKNQWKWPKMDEISFLCDSFLFFQNAGVLDTVTTIQ